jgi:hypothetical protein
MPRLCLVLLFRSWLKLDLLSSMLGRVEIFELALPASNANFDTQLFSSSPSSLCDFLAGVKYESPLGGSFGDSYALGIAGTGGTSSSSWNPAELCTFLVRFGVGIRDDCCSTWLFLDEAPPFGARNEL